MALRTLRAHCWLLLLPALLLLGACQRAGYSFQVPTTTLQAAPTASALDSGASWAAARLDSSVLALQLGARHSRLRRPHAKALARQLPGARAQLLARLPVLARLVTPARAAPNKPATTLVPRPSAGPDHLRSKGIAVLLAFFLGGIGAHLFYLGYYGRGAAYLIVTAVGLALFVAAVIAAIVTLGSGAGFIALATIGGVLSGLVNLLALVDAIRIAIGDLKPKNGEYFPRFFQTHDKPQPTR